MKKTIIVFLILGLPTLINAAADAGGRLEAQRRAAYQRHINEMARKRAEADKARRQASSDQVAATNARLARRCK